MTARRLTTIAMAALLGAAPLAAQDTARVRSRQEQLEDWIAVLAGNHLFSAIDAYVAAHLWDVPLEVELRSSSRRRGLALRLYW